MSTNGITRNGHSAHPATSTMTPSACANGIFGCHWVEKIDWESPTLQRFPDPTRSFSFLVIAIMVLRFLEAREWNVQEALFGFFLNPYVVLAFSISLAVAYWSSSTSSRPLSVADRWAAEWYFWNAALFHLVMDGFSGTFHLVPVVVQQYFVLDNRFRTHHVVPWIIGLVEITCMAPLCLLTLWAILKRHPLRYPLELVTSTFQFMGMVVFVAAEVYEGQLNVPANDPVGILGDRWANTKLNLYHFTYYWFGFWFCNLIWGFVPYYRAMRSLRECQIGMEKGYKQD